jgi:hypothetical protein
MTKEILDGKLKALENKYSQERTRLFVEYARSGCTVDPGEVITDGAVTIAVTSSQVAFTFGTKYPEMKYTGLRLRKDNTPFKSGERGAVYQSRISRN